MRAGQWGRTKFAGNRFHKAPIRMKRQISARGIKLCRLRRCSQRGVRPEVGGERDHEGEGEALLPRRAEGAASVQRAHFHRARADPRRSRTIHTTNLYQNMDETTLRAILKSVINDEKLAKSEGVAKIHHKLEEHDSKLNSAEEKLNDMETRFKDVEENRAPSTPRPLRTSTGSRSIATTSSPGAEWTPRLIHIKGFAEYGCPSSQKIRKDMLEQTQTTLLRHAPRHITDHMAPMGGFAVNHQISFEVMDRDIATFASHLDSWLQDQKFTVLGKALRAMVETPSATTRMRPVVLASQIM